MCTGFCTEHHQNLGLNRAIDNRCASGLFHHLYRNDIRLPFRDDDGCLNWRCPAKTTVCALLKHPLYAGTFGYGRTKRYGGKRRDVRQQQQRKHLPPEQWKVLKKDCCPAYISWEQYEFTRRSLLEQTHLDAVQRSRYNVDLAHRRYEQVDPANRLVASSLERNWEATLKQLATAEAALIEFRQQQSSTLSQYEQEQIHDACTDISKLWNGHAELKDKKELVRLLIDRVVVRVPKNSEQVKVSIAWTGGYESHHQIIRTVMNYRQLEQYDRLLSRTLELPLQGLRSPAVADILHQEGFRTPRRQQRISADMVKNLLREPSCAQQLNAPEFDKHEWLAEEMAAELGLSLKRLKDWVTRGWSTASQRPFGRTWLIWADDRELSRLHRLAKHQRRPGGVPPSIELRTPTHNIRIEQYKSGNRQ